MGIRMDQYIGLNHRALDLVAGEKILLYTKTEERVYPDGGEETIGPEQIYGSNIKREESDDIYFGMFGQEYPLYRYIFPDGRVLVEFLQAAPWSSGPMFFVALKDGKTGKKVEESLWTEEEIDRKMNDDLGFYDFV